MNKLVIVKYNAGNIQSVLYALERIGVAATVTDDHALVKSAGKVIFPGVGEASSAMRYLKERGLDELLKSLRQPVLGICLGMQLMCTYSEENNTGCLGIFDETVRLFQPAEQQNLLHRPDDVSITHKVTETANVKQPPLVYKVPQVGWNSIYNLQSPLFNGIPESSYCYFVHSYYAALGPHTIAATDYVQAYSAALHKNNFYGVQFHPEKSATVGEQILKNFLEL